MFHASGRFWIFYEYSLTYIGYRSSLDGETWSSPVIALVQTHSGSFSLVYDNSTYIHLAYPGLYGNFYYMRGRPNSDGSITFDGQKTISSLPNDFHSSSIAVNSTGGVYITYSNQSGGITPYLTHNALTNGSWLTASGFPIELNNTVRANWRTLCTVLENDNVSCLYTSGYAPPSSYVLHKLYFVNNASLSSEETASNLFYSETAGDHNLGAVSFGNDVYMSYHSGTDDIFFTKRTYLNFTWPTHNETNVQNTAGQTAHTLSLDYINNRVYIIKNSNGLNLVNVTYFDIDAETFTTQEIVEDNGGSLDKRFMQAYYQIYNYTLALAYVYPGAQPYTIRHIYLDFTPAPPIDPGEYWLPIRLTMGLLGLLFIIIAPTISAHQIIKKKNYNAIILGIFLFCFGYGLLCAWLF